MGTLILIRFKVLLSPPSLSPPLKGKGRDPLLGWQVLSDNPPNSKFRFIDGEAYQIVARGFKEVENLLLHIQLKIFMVSWEMTNIKGMINVIIPEIVHLFETHAQL